MIPSLAVKGLIETQRKLREAAEALHGKPIIAAMRTATLLVERDAKILAPVDTGRLRASIHSEVTVEGLFGRKVKGIVGSNVVYAPYMELGTKPHFPPIGAIELWARRHGVNAFIVARAIARRGLRPRKYLQGAFEKNQSRIISILGYAVTSIVHKANQ